MQPALRWASLPNPTRVKLKLKPAQTRSGCLSKLLQNLRREKTQRPKDTRGGNSGLQLHSEAERHVANSLHKDKFRFLLLTPKNLLGGICAFSLQDCRNPNIWRVALATLTVFSRAPEPHPDLLQTQTDGN